MGDSKTPHELAFDEREEQLRQWPYSVHAIDETLHAKRIEARAKQLLFQALNRRNLVAFVGSGVPMAYGRLSWSDWLEFQIEAIRNVAGAFLECSKCSIRYIDAQCELLKNPSGWDCLTESKCAVLTAYLNTRRLEIGFHMEEVRQLFETLRLLDDDGGAFVQSEVAVGFEVASKLQDMLLRNTILFCSEQLTQRYWVTQEKEIFTRIFEATSFGFNEKLDHGSAPQPLFRKWKETVESMSTDERFNSARGSFHQSWKDYFRILLDPASRVSVADLAKLLLVDECAHSENILRKALFEQIDSNASDKVRLIRENLTSVRRDNLKRDIGGIRDNPRRYWTLGFFKTASFQAVLKKLKGNRGVPLDWQQVIQVVQEELEKNRNPPFGQRREVKRVFVSPTHRFVFRVLMALVARPFELFEGWPENEADMVRTLDDTRPKPVDRVFLPVSRSDFLSRRSIMDDELDPLEKSVISLRIRQFLTTNYDFEIERYFQDRGYTRFQEDLRDGNPFPLEVRRQNPDNYRVDGIGGVLKDDTFERPRASDLISFSINQDDADASVFHLHGRATNEANLVITERDYMDLYVRNDEFRDTVDESIRIAFSANPLLLMGLGMNEADVLRPLREFMSDNDRALGRTAIVLSPALDSRAIRAQDAALRYVRYGTHTIYFGDGWVEYPQVRQNKTDDGDPEKAAVDRYVQFDWLHRVCLLIDKLKGINRTLRKRLQPDDKKPVDDGKPEADLADLVDSEAIFRELKEAVGEVKLPGSDSKSIAALDLLFKATTGNAAETGLAAKSIAAGAVTCVARQVCFTERNPGEYKERHQWGGPFKWHEPHLSFEYGLLPVLLLMTVRGLSGEKPGAIVKNKERHLRDLNARIVALNGLKNALITATMCIALDELEREREAWWLHWQRSPPERVARFSRKDDPVALNPEPGNFRIPVRFVRHELNNVITEIPDDARVASWGTTDDAGTGIHAFDTFTRSLRSRIEFDCGPKPHGGRRQMSERVSDGRRLHVVIAHRGAGKGSFMSAFASNRGLADYIRANWPLTGAKRRFPIYVSAMFVNLSFSTEVASTFDMLIDAIWRSVGVLTASSRFRQESGSFKDVVDGDALKRKRELRGLSRIRHLRQAFAEFHNEARAWKKWNIGGAHYQPRLLICMNAIELLHFAHGLTKNREVEEILKLLISDELSDHPIDIVLISGETNISETLATVTPFVRKYNAVCELPAPASANGADGQLLYIPTVRPDIDANGIQNIARRMERSHIEFGEMSIKPREDGKVGAIEPDWPSPSRNTNTVAYVHFARTVKPESLLVDNFLPLALFLFHGFVVEKCRLDKEEKIGELWPGTSDIEDLGIRLTRQERDKIWEKKDPLKHWERRKRQRELKAAVLTIQLATRAIETVSDLNTKNNYSRFREIASKASSTLDLCRYISLPELPKSEAEAQVAKSERQAVMRCARAVLLERYNAERNDDPTTNRAFQEWREISAILANNRYCLTIMLAAAQRLGLSGRTLRDACDRAERFIRNTIDRVNMVGANKREEVVLHDVLDAYEAFDQFSAPSEDIRLHLAILRHLAVMACPCSTDVLVRTPEIRHYFETIHEGHERSRELRLTEAMTEMAERGLIFKVAPHPRLSDRLQSLKAAVECTKKGTKERKKAEKDIDEIYGELEPESAFRYALHRLMQAHISRKMGSGQRDTAQINGFAPSLFASMPADLPRLNHEAYGFLKNLVASLSQYPDHKSAMPGPENWHYQKTSVSTQVQALRAALSVVRSTFSIAVVSRFEDYSVVDENLGMERGYFEEYRVQVRWLIRKAFELLYRKPERLRDYCSESEDFEHINAFYTDEIVWLYNECGVVNLVQGNLADAVILLRQAISINRRVEGQMNGGPQHNRLSLNLAVAQLERGRIDSARSRLEEICESEGRHGKRKGRVWHLAHGYLGLVCHLLGDRTAAKRHYREAIDVLRVYEDTRACAVFSRHLGDLERGRGSHEQSHRHLNDAMSFAEAGGHEDVHKRTRLSVIRLEIDIAHRAGNRADVKELNAELKIVGDYADTMEMPALRCDVDHVRAELMINDGETTLAGQLLSRNITIAKRNDMNLRLNSALTRYAQVLALRGLKDQANKLLFTSLEMAKRNRCQLEIKQVEKVFETLHQA